MIAYSIKNREKVTDKDYIEIHELVRHVIHSIETLDVGARTVRAMRDAHCARCRSEKPLVHYHHIQGDLEFYELFLQNLRARASAFDQRLLNEIKSVRVAGHISPYRVFNFDCNICQAANLLATEDSATAKEILKGSQHDGRDLTNLVALLTLVFLPASFLTVNKPNLLLYYL